MNNRIHSFPPQFRSDAKLLILGSMPGVESLRQQQYYAYPRNHFWPLMEKVLAESLPEKYDARCLWLQEHGVALWDSLQSCQRKGSLDSSIKSAEANDIPSLLQKAPDIKAIFFNGSAAQKHFLRFYELPEGIDGILLPSSSPIPRKGFITIEDKLPAWLAIRHYL